MDFGEHRQAADPFLLMSEIYSYGAVSAASVKSRSRTAAILAHDAALYFNFFLSAGFDARAARSRHCLARFLYSATTSIASRLCRPTAIRIWISSLLNNRPRQQKAARVAGKSSWCEKKEAVFRGYGLFSTGDPFKSYPQAYPEIIHKDIRSYREFRSCKDQPGVVRFELFGALHRKYLLKIGKLRQSAVDYCG